MQRKDTDRARQPHPMAGQPREDEDENDLQKPEDVPSFLTARELQARVPAKPKPASPAEADEDDAGDDKDDARDLDR